MNKREEGEEERDGVYEMETIFWVLLREYSRKV